MEFDKDILNKKMNENYENLLKTFNKSNKREDYKINIDEFNEKFNELKINITEEISK